MSDPSVPLLYHLEALSREREMRYQQRYEAQQAAMTAAFAAAEVARAVKERGDRDALLLAREIQTYKDEKANNLREQIGGERGMYATKGDLKAATEKLDVALAPVLTYISSQQGRSSGLDKGWAIIIGAAGLVATIIAALAFLSK
jgi:hypothetical protein